MIMTSGEKNTLCKEFSDVSCYLCICILGTTIHSRRKTSVKATTKRINIIPITNDNVMAKVKAKLKSVSNEDSSH